MRPKRTHGTANEGDADLAVRFRAHLTESGLIHAGARVLVAISGGLDSTVLLHLLRFAPLFPMELHAAHFDHAMRAGSPADARWVAGLCHAWNVPLQTSRAEPPPRTETRARELRYAFLEEAADAIGADVIATAHHADDQAETVLFRILRGTGLRGLAGIPARRGRIVRPLLAFERSELRAYARRARIRHREDPTNVMLTYARNRIRHVVLPALEARVPGVSRALTCLANDAALAETLSRQAASEAARALIRQSREGVIELAAPPLARYHPFLRARVLRAALGRLGSTPDRSGTRAALEFITAGAGGGVIELAGGVRIERNFDRLVLRRGRTPAPVVDQTLVIRGTEPGHGMAVIGGTRFAVKWAPSAHEREAHAAVFDPSALMFPLELRGWRPGDRVRLDYGSKKLKKLFAERRVAREARVRVPVLADAHGRILWVPGLTRAAVSAPVPGGPAFQITVKHAERG